MKPAMILYQIFALLVLFAGGYLLLRYGMNVDSHTSLYISIIAMPVVTFIIWFTRYKGKEFR
jgi:MFS-type transporter involved in bile tolerance (Atg22 family)